MQWSSHGLGSLGAMTRDHGEQGCEVHRTGFSAGRCACVASVTLDGIPLCDECYRTLMVFVREAEEGA